MPFLFRALSVTLVFALTVAAGAAEPVPAAPPAAPPATDPGYQLSVGDTINVELLNTEDKHVTFEPLLVIDGDNVRVGEQGERPGVIVGEMGADHERGREQSP